MRRSPRNYAVRLLVSVLVIHTANLTFGGRERIFFGGRERIFLDAIESSGWLFHRNKKNHSYFDRSCFAFYDGSSRTTDPPRHLVMGVGVSPVLLNANASLNGNGDGNPKDDFDSYGNVSVAY